MDGPLFARPTVKEGHLMIHGTVFTSKSAKIEGGGGQMYP